MGTARAFGRPAAWTVVSASGTYLWALGVGVAAVLSSYGLLRSRLGLALTAIRDEETAARSVGVGVLRTQMIVWVIAAFGCGLAGAVYEGLSALYIQPEAAFTRQPVGVHDLHRRDRRHGHDRGADHRHRDLLRAAAVASGHGSWYLIILGGVAVVAAVWLRAGLWGAVGSRVGGTSSRCSAACAI